PTPLGHHELGEGVTAADVGEGGLIFVMARTTSGQLVATEALGELSFPVRFELDATDIMAHGQAVTPPFALSARLDKDRDAMTKDAGDLYAEMASPVGGPASDLKLVLKKAAPAGAASQPAHP
ncbi:MAG: hypothetical protein HC923_07735, partial [Myxococcales bacterium]|nr:hypothetical protein [Myxococcales bacterium]